MRDRFNERYIAAIKADCMHECCLESGFVKLSKADTFIEYCFEMACAHMNRGLDVLTEWRYRKDQYCKITDTIIYDFAHYSKHDSSHSVSILETIELVIGDERIVKLSRGDLWLLLESAYSHDIGMALTGKELHDLWSDPDFKEYLLVLCQDLVQVKMRNFSHFNPPEAQPQCVFFHTIVRIHLVTYSYNGYEFVSYCRKLPDIQKSTGMPAYSREF